MPPLAAMVGARRREIGLRMAVGVDRKDVAALILLRVSALVLSGLAFGSLMALFAAYSLSTTDWWRPLLFGVSWFDLRTYFSILIVFGVTSLIASFLPVRRAVRVDPMRVLRDE